MVPFEKALVCLLLIFPLTNSIQISRKTPRDVSSLPGQITSFTGVGQQDLRANIPGEPGVDYPIYSSPPDTSFSCFNRHEGYYADVETRCQVFRICSHTDHTGKGFAFLCPNGTLFSQHDFVCDWYRNVACESSPNFYFMNELLDKSVNPRPELLMKDIVAMVNYPVKMMKQQQTYKNIFPQVPSIVSSTPTPIAISPSTEPAYFSRLPSPALPNTFPVRNPFKHSTKTQHTSRLRPFQHRQPQIQQPQEIPSFPERNPLIQNIQHPTPAPTPELFTPAGSPTPEITHAPILDSHIDSYNPEKVYISSLGELSTDPGSNFDPKTAVILPDQSQEQSPIFTQAGNQEHLLEGKLEPSQNDATKNLLLNIENIASSVPGNLNSQLALVRDQPLVDGGVIQLPGTLHVNLNYTQRINTALKNVLIPSTAQDQLAINSILSGGGKVISQIYGQNQLPDNSGILKFAHNINSAFQLNNPLLSGGQHPVLGEGKELFGSKDLTQPQHTNSFTNSDDAGFLARNTPYTPDTKLSIQAFPSASGQQGSQGVGFTKSTFAVSTPASILHSQTIYIPSINLKLNPSTEKTFDVTATTEPHSYLNQIPVTVQSALSDPELSQDKDQLTAANQHYGSNSEQVRQNGLDSIRTYAKRAENLLLKGVQLSLYDSAKNEDLPSNNHIDDNTHLSAAIPEVLPQSTQSPSTTTSTTAISTEPERQDKDDSNGPLKITISTEDIIGSLSPPTPSYEFPVSTEQNPSNLFVIDPVEYSTMPSFNQNVTTQILSAPDLSTPSPFTKSHPEEFIELEITPRSAISSIVTPIESTTPISTSIVPFTTTSSTASPTPKPSKRKSFKPKKHLFTRVQTNRLTVTTTTTTPRTTSERPTNSDQLGNIRPTESTSYGIRAALSKSRNKALGHPIATSRGAATFKRITNRGRHLQSTTHIIHNQSSQPDASGTQKASSSYTNIPGTKISIAKSIEEGFFSVSNYPLLPNVNKPMSFSSIFPGIIIHPGSPFMLRQKSDLNSNYLLPFPTLSTIKATDKTTLAAITTTPAPTIKISDDIISSTPIPSLTSIPLAPHIAQRRSDFLDADEDEEAFFKGVSSYNVPLNSVGRLPADIQETNKR